MMVNVVLNLVSSVFCPAEGPLEPGTGLITQIVLSPLPARMGTLLASSGTQGPTLDVQVTGPALLLSAFQHSRWSSRAINSDTPRHKLPKSTYLDFCHPQLPGCMLQVLQGLETYITTEKFLHTLEAASAEWIDLSDHKQQPHKAWGSSSSELSEVGFLQL